MTRSTRKPALAAIALGVAALVPMGMAVSPAAASGPSGPIASGATASGPGGTAPVQPGISAAALPGATRLGATPGATTETVSFVLRERNLPLLQTSAESGASRYVSVSQFAAFFGQSQRNVHTLQHYLAGFGITSQAYPDRVDVVATGTAAKFEKALSVRQSQYRVPRQHGRGGLRPVPAQTVHGIAAAPRLPRPIARYVLAILGLTNYGPFGSQAVHTDTSLARPQPASGNSCVKLSGLPDACHLPADYASRYGLDPLYRKGADGRGQTLAIVTLAAVDPGGPQHYWSHIAHVPATGRTLSLVNVDGGPGAPSDSAGSGETDLDVEQSGALAPGANVLVYQAPNTDYGFADAFFDAASQDAASSVSASWLESETYLQASVADGTESPGYQAAFDEAFLEMAVQGQSGFIASGDWAAYTATADLHTTDLSVGASSDSPYITAAGGTTLPWSGKLTGPDGSATVTVPAQRTWGWDYLWRPVAKISGESLAKSAESQVTGSGGGFSGIERTPLYQYPVPGTQDYTAVRYLTPAGYKKVDGLREPTSWTFNPHPALTHGTGSGRAVPDVSADADPYTGYLLYAPSFAGAGQPTLQGGWGGTSFVAPQLNGSAAVIDSYLGHRTGFWNPAIYGFAVGHSSPFTPLQHAGPGNDNLYYTGNQGQLYNQGSGLGYPDLSRLAADFAGPSWAARS